MLCVKSVEKNSMFAKSSSWVPSVRKHRNEDCGQLQNHRPEFPCLVHNTPSKTDKVGAYSQHSKTTSFPEAVRDYVNNGIIMHKHNGAIEGL